MLVLGVFAYYSSDSCRFSGFYRILSDYIASRCTDTGRDRANTHLGKVGVDTYLNETTCTNGTIVLGDVALSLLCCALRITNYTDDVRVYDITSS